jgi:epoxyqueuosine reductase
MQVATVTAEIKQLALALGFDDVGITGIDLAPDEQYLLEWLARGFHGELFYMERFGSARARPAEITPGTIRVISVRLNYWPADAAPALPTLADGTKAYISRYALGRDYHRLMRYRLQTLTDQIKARVSTLGARVFVDSGPVLEKPLARNAGLGWIGKHTNLIHAKTGSYFFLGEIYIDYPLIIDQPASAHCGSCEACLPACPTNAIVAPYQLDARRCISYLTIELKGSIPEEFRPLMGNRIYGCDDCQLVCPWNSFATGTREPGFNPRLNLDAPHLTELFAWSEADFEQRLAGSPIRRIGHERWLRNIAIALGNAPPSSAVREALSERLSHPSALVREHVQWALAQQDAARSKTVPMVEIDRVSN